MTTTFAPVSLPGIAPPDPSKHVNYELGMVLGVDDFMQEFAYGAARDQRLARELVGYGVVSGLRVTVETETDGPRVKVAPGELVTPSGQFVSIFPAQCAHLNDWLRANRARVDEISSPPPSVLELSIVACYAECLTDEVPIPGEPCRSDDELHQPSRVQDSFRLELRPDAPDQVEADAIRDFIAWVRRIPVVDAPAGDVEAFVDELRAAMELGATSPPSPPAALDFLLASPPPAMQIPRAAAAEYLAALVAFWVSDLRPLVHADPGTDCLRLATLSVPLTVDAVSGAVLVADTPPVAVHADDAVRPTLLHLRLLQEWLVASTTAEEAAPVVVAGRVAADGSTVAARGGLAARQLDPTLFLLTFPAFAPDADYVVTGQPAAAADDPQASTFEVIPTEDPGLATALGSPPAQGIVVRVRTATGDPVPAGFTVRIEEL